MEHRWAFLVLLCTLAGIHAAEPEFPKLSDIYVEFYQTEVVLTDLNQQVSAFVKEYFDGIQNRGRIEMLEFGNKKSVFYYNETNEILEVNSTHCLVWLTDESQFYYEEMFYGWLQKDPLVIGPSALLWAAQNNREKIKYVGEEFARDINCEKFTQTLDDDRNKITIDYYFAVSTWTTPYMLKVGDKVLRVPVRVSVSGSSSKNRKAADDLVPVNETTDFVYFRPSVKDWLGFQPPYGLGCPLRKPTLDMPKIPKMYKLSAEVVDLLASEKSDTTDINFSQLWYDGLRKLGRVDYFDRLGFTSELYDFNTGVTYKQKNGETCKLIPLKESWFEGFDSNMMGYFKDPDEVLGLDGSFYYMGVSRVRGMRADVFEKVVLDTYIGGTELSKLVVTAYFTKEFMKVAVDGEPEDRVLIYLVVTGYETNSKIVMKRQYSVFGFDDVVWPAMYESFQLERCFPLEKQKSYFVLILNVDPDFGALLEKQNDVFIEQLKFEISQRCNISEMRIPLLKADYKSSGVTVAGLMLDRPPVLSQFWYFMENYITAHDNPKPAINAETEEDCAFACIGEIEFCSGFYMCGKTCFLKSSGILDKEGDTGEEFGRTCKIYIRAERDSTNNEDYLGSALEKLKKAVDMKEIVIEITVETDNKKITPIEEVIIGGGPYTSDDSQEKPYKTMFEGFQLLPEEESESTVELSYIDNLDECYKSCKTSESISCTSFSYCSKAENKQCRISSTFIKGGKDNYEDVAPNALCKTYSLKYLDFYEALDGQVSLVPGDLSFNSIDTAEECAKNCRSEKGFTCRGFEYCRGQKVCVLHKKHVFDYKKNELVDSKGTRCTHYAAKYLADYYDMGYTLIDDDSNKRVELTVEECARACSEELPSCKSFNYCPSLENPADSTCSMSTKTILDDGIKTITKDKCHHYTKIDGIDDWGKAAKPVKTTGYTSKGFTGLVIGMIALGLIVGILAFVGYSYMRSRSSADNMTVRFMKQADT